MPLIKLLFKSLGKALVQQVVTTVAVVATETIVREAIKKKSER